jgi:hypothetical protein
MRTSIALKNGADIRYIGWEVTGYNLIIMSVGVFEVQINPHPMKFHNNQVAIAPASVLWLKLGKVTFRANAP